MKKLILFTVIVSSLFTAIFSAALARTSLGIKIINDYDSPIKAVIAKDKGTGGSGLSACDNIASGSDCTMTDNSVSGRDLRVVIRIKPVDNDNQTIASFNVRVESSADCFNGDGKQRKHRFLLAPGYGLKQTTKIKGPISICQQGAPSKTFTVNVTG